MYEVLSEFVPYREAYSHVDGLMARCLLPRKEKRQIAEDFERLIGYYTNEGLTGAQIRQRIGGDVLGDFYRPPDSDEWYPLDSAAKVYPLSMTRTRMSVYRVSVYLKEPVVPCVLQVALLSTVKRFPLFATTVKRGFFWHYMDAARRRFAVSQENALPCSRLDVSRRRSPNFRVVYYGNRISMEAFHILTDGIGAMTFLKTLTREYLRLLGHDVPYDRDIFRVDEPPKTEELRDDFSLGDRVKSPKGFFDKPALHMGGRTTHTQPAGVLHFVMSARQLLSAARDRDTTVTALVLSAIFLGARATVKRPGEKGVFHIQVPVDMRRYYPSRSLRNFSMYCIVRIPYTQVTDLDTLLPMVAAQLKEGASKESLDRMMALTRGLTGHWVMRLTPLRLKCLFIKPVYWLCGGRVLTTVFSNLGMIKNDFKGHVDKFDCMMGPSKYHKAGCAMISYGDHAVFTIIKSTKDTAFEKKVHEVLTGAGITIAVEGMV